jgi:putative isomerase
MMTLKLDLAQIPFSRRGSYLAVSARPSSRADSPPVLWIRSVREVFRPSQLLRLETLRHGAVCRYTCQVEPGCLSLLVEGGGCVDITFDGPDTLRFRVLGCTLHLSSSGGGVGEGADSLSQVTPAGIGRWRLVCGAASLAFLQKLAGHVTVQADWTGLGSTHNTILIAGETEPAEAAFCDGSGIECEKSDGKPFDACVRLNRADFDEFLAAQLPCQEDYEETRRLAAYLNWSCLVAPDGFLCRQSMLMSKNVMTALWSWDHCFNALALRRSSPELAWDQFLAPFDHQNRQGALPDLICSRMMVRTYVKPPIHGWAFRQLWQAAPAFFTRERLIEAGDKLARLTDFWMTHRDPYGAGLPVYYHGNDSGWDNSTCFLAGSPLTSPELPAFLVIQMETIAEIAAATGESAKAESWRTRARNLLDRMLAMLWKNGTWRVLTPATPESVPPPGSDSLLPYVALVLGDRLPAEIRCASIAQMTEAGRFLTPYGLATESRRSPYYVADGYWRGPIWAPSTLLIVDGLERAGEMKLARSLARAFCDLCRGNGLAENFDAGTGAGLRDRGYTWTASVFLELASRLHLSDK